MKKIMMLLLILVVFAFNHQVFAVEEVVLNAPESVYTALQEGLSCKEVVSYQTKEIEVLKTELTILDAEVISCNNQVQTAKDMVEVVQDISKTQENAITDMQGIVKEQQKNCKDLIEASKPSWFDRLKEGALYFISGAVTATVIILL